MKSMELVISKESALNKPLLSEWCLSFVDYQHLMKHIDLLFYKLLIGVIEIVTEVQILLWVICSSFGLVEI